MRAQKLACLYQTSRCTCLNNNRQRNKSAGSAFCQSPPSLHCLTKCIKEGRLNDVNYLSKLKEPSKESEGVVHEEEFVHAYAAAVDHYILQQPSNQTREASVKHEPKTTAAT
jgi:hypothetical protein